MYPALAVVEALKDKAEILWVGGEGGMERTLVTQAGIAFRAIPAAGVHGVGVKMLPANLTKLMRGYVQARRILREYNPHVLFFTGGYVGVPMSMAGRKRPQMAYVPDIEPGLALKWMSRFADCITVTTPESVQYYQKPERVVVSGYPTRAYLHPHRESACSKLNLDPSEPVLLVFGGSRGARSINQALWGCLAELLPDTQIVHITGELDWPQALPIAQNLGSLQSKYHAYAYLHDEMADALAAADLVVSRAGASTLGEFTLLGLPSILVPYPYAWRYQKTNAAYLADRGAALMLSDGDLPARLLIEIRRLLGAADIRQQMSAVARSLARPLAAQTIAEEMIKLAQGRDHHD